MTTTAYEAFASRYKADPADPMCGSDLAKYTDGWDDARAAAATPPQDRPAPDECPVCRSKDIRVHEGDTFRWRYAICDACGFQGEEVRIQTLGNGTREEWEAAVRIDAIADMHRIYTACTAAKDAEIERLTALAETLKLEAQIHAGEARTANATIAEIYKVVTGCTGEPGNWHGARPVRMAFEALAKRVAEMEAAQAWQPIDAAPRDGSYLLLWEQWSDAPFVGYWSQRRKLWCANHEHLDAEGGWNGAVVVDKINQGLVTQWKPVGALPDDTTSRQSSAAPPAQGGAV